MRPQLGIAITTVTFAALAGAAVQAQSAAPALLSEAQLAQTLQTQVLQQQSAVVGVPADAVLQQVTANLAATPMARQHPDITLNTTLLGSDVMNAFAAGGGAIYLDQGLLSALGTEPGYLAAVIGHESGHNLEHHIYRAYERQWAMERLAAELGDKAAAGSKAAAVASLVARLGGSLLALKFSRDQELQADRDGMELMAQAGYHPDFMLAAFHHLTVDLGDSSHVAAFFQNHPLWSTRDAKLQQVYGQALADFQRRWPDAAASPGGAPPLVVELGQVQVSERSESVVLAVPVAARNGPDQTLSIAALITEPKRVATPGVRQAIPLGASGAVDRTLALVLPCPVQHGSFEVQIGALQRDHLLDLENLRLRAPPGCQHKQLVLRAGLLQVTPAPAAESAVPVADPAIRLSLPMGVEAMGNSGAADALPPGSMLPPGAGMPPDSAVPQGTNMPPSSALPPGEVTPYNGYDPSATSPESNATNATAAEYPESYAAPAPPPPPAVPNAAASSPVAVEPGFTSAALRLGAAMAALPPAGH